MGIVQKQGAFNTVIYYVGTLLGYFNMVYLLPNTVSPDQFGLVNLIFPFASVLSLFSLLGIPNIMIRFFPRFRNSETHHSGFLFFGLTVTVLGVIASTALFFLLKDLILSNFEEKSRLFVDNYYYIFPLALAITGFELFNSYSRAHFLTVAPTLINEVIARIFVLISTLLLHFGWIDFRTFLTLFVGSYLMNMVILLIYLSGKRILMLRPSREMFKWQNLQEIVSYGAFNFFGGASGFIVDKIDVLFIGSYIGLAQLGVYRVALMIAMVIALPAKALMQILYPLSADAFQKKDWPKLKLLYQSSSYNQLLAGGILFLLAAFNYKSIFMILKPEFAAGLVPFIIIGLARLFDMVTGINGPLIVNSKFYRYDLLFTSILVGLTWVANRLLVPKYGLVGGAIATFSAIVIYNAVKYFFVWAKLDMQPFTFQTLKILLSLLGIATIVYFIPDIRQIPVVDVAIKTFAILALALATTLFFKLSPEISDIISGQYDKMLARLRKGKPA